MADIILIYTLVVDAVAGVAAFAFLLRFWMQAIRVRPAEPFGRFTYVMSNWLVQPLRRVIPGIGGYDWACLVGAYLIAILATLAILVFAAAMGTTSLAFKAVILGALIELVNWIYWSFIFTLVLQVAISWINPYAPMAPFIGALNDPLCRPIRRIIPPIGGIDFSCMVVMLLLFIARHLAIRGIGLLA